SSGIGAWNTPLIPPITNIVTNPIAKSIGALSSIAPPHIVAIQLKILMPLGTAIARVMTMNGTRAELEKPVVNMGWTHTPKDGDPRDEQGQVLEREAGGAVPEDRDEEVDRARGRRNAEQLQSDDPHVDAGTGVVHTQRRVAGPSDVRGPEPHDDAGDRDDPEA